MKKFIMILLVLSVGIVIGKVWFHVAETEAANKIEYQILLTKLNHYTMEYLLSPEGTEKKISLEIKLNQYAETGWEIVGFSDTVIIFKKEFK
jgi:predicted secreted protein